MAQGPVSSILVTIRIRESVLDHDSILLAFGGGLYTLSTSNLIPDCFRSTAFLWFK